MVAAEVRSANRSPWGLLDAVLHVAAGAIDVLIEPASFGLGRPERSHDEARVRALRQVLGLGDDPAAAAPAVQRGPAELGEAAGGLAGGCALGGRGGQLVRDRRDQAVVAGEPEDIVD